MSHKKKDASLGAEIAMMPPTHDTQPKTNFVPKQTQPDKAKHRRTGRARLAICNSCAIFWQLVRCRTQDRRLHTSTRGLRRPISLTCSLRMCALPLGQKRGPRACHYRSNILYVGLFNCPQAGGYASGPPPGSMQNRAAIHETRNRQSRAILGPEEAGV